MHSQIEFNACFFFRLYRLMLTVNNFYFLFIYQKINNSTSSHLNFQKGFNVNVMTLNMNENDGLLGNWYISIVHQILIYDVVEVFL